MNPISEWDISVLDWIAEHMRCAFLDGFLSTITHLAEAGWFWIVIAVVMLCFRKTRKYGWYVGIALLIGLLVCNVTLKPLVGRIRPWDYVAAYHPEHGELNLLVEKLHDFSFPSGHTIASIEAATALMFWKKRAGIPALVLAVIISFSRLYLYVHYVTDVLASVVLGIAIAFLARFLVNLAYKKIEAYKAAKASKAE